MSNFKYSSYSSANPVSLGWIFMIDTCFDDGYDGPEYRDARYEDSDWVKKAMNLHENSSPIEIDRILLSFIKPMFNRLKSEHRDLDTDKMLFTLVVLRHVVQHGTRVMEKIFEYIDTFVCLDKTLRDKLVCVITEYLQKDDNSLVDISRYPHMYMFFKPIRIPKSIAPKVELPIDVENDDSGNDDVKRGDAVLEDAVLEDAELEDAVLEDADLEDADLEDYVEDAQCFIDPSRIFKYGDPVVEDTVLEDAVVEDAEWFKKAFFIHKKSSRTKISAILGHFDKAIINRLFFAGYGFSYNNKTLFSLIVLRHVVQYGTRVDIEKIFDYISTFVDIHLCHQYTLASIIREYLKKDDKLVDVSRYPHVNILLELEYFKEFSDRVVFLSSIPNFNTTDLNKTTELVSRTTSDSDDIFTSQDLIALSRNTLKSEDVGSFKLILDRTEEILVKTLIAGFFSVGVRQGEMHQWHISAFGGYIGADLLSLLTYITGKTNPLEIHRLTSEKTLLLFDYIDLVFNVGSIKLSTLFYNMALKTVLINPELFEEVSAKILRNDQSFAPLLERQDALNKRFG